MTGQSIISADSHVQEPPDLYERLPKAMRDRAPRKVVRDGKTYVLVDGRKPRRIDLAESRATEDDQNREFRNDPSGGRDLDLRLKDLARVTCRARACLAPILRVRILAVGEGMEGEHQAAVLNS